MGANRLRESIVIIVLAALYFGASKLGFTMAFTAEQVTLVWPPTGIALVAVLLFGYRVWPGIALGAFLANITTAAPVATALGITVGNTLEALVGAFMLRRFIQFSNRLDRLKDVLGLVFFSAGLSTMISATIGVTSLCLGGVQPWSSYGTLWLTWWLGDAAGALIVAPVLLVWSCKSEAWKQPGNIAQGLALIGGLTITCLSIFTDTPVLGLTGHAFIYLIFPFIILASMRFGQHGTTFVTLTAAAIAIWATLHGVGPFTHTSIEQGLMSLQVFMATVAVTGLCLSAAISEGKWATQILRESEARFRLMADTAPILIWMSDTDKKHDYFNKPWLDFTGRTLEQEQGDGWMQGVHPDDLEGCLKTYVNAFDARWPFEMEYRLRHKSGAYRWIMDHGVPRFTPQGEFAGYIGSCIDITRRKEAEKAITESDRRKDEFLATLAHELRNPLAPFANALHVLRRPDAEAPRREEALDIMDHQLRHVVRLVDDLLDVSRISHGKIDLRKKPVALADAINMALETAGPLIEAGGHTLSVDIPQETLWLDADLTRLAQVFANLLSNAAKYTGQGGHIWLEAAAISDNVTVTVRDTGIGIAPEMLPRIFEMFTQADTSIERVHGGLGIGLMLVSTLVGMHGGSVVARSRGLGQGSEFIVRLPLAAPPAALPPSPELPVAAPPSDRRLRILVVDDHKNLAKTLGWMVESLGHDVQLAYDGAEALSLACSYVPDVILLDIGLSGMSGYEVAEKLRQEPALKNCVLIAQTGWGQPEHRRRSKEAGFDYHLVKPVEMETLERLFNSLSAAA